ncbi:serine/threonine-protein kinase [Candidatus Mycobacterium methanotrophicum]|uniref:non-specific serine/threonine protein kinase n=1 Tax=Candidatus Mycobacterium methanotrophicum TaxID=2943498 RepID=A0ABY4QNE8_9MYCO|nr:serine/threonine-protein kinase [Candidatus Mycobacterium methanotrophicum]UQX12493.1 serine/threonine protein kinase [Candidatus Mycobacterium methanotrophicum]
MNEETNNTQRWDVDQRPVSAQQRARDAPRRGYQSVPHLALTQLLHRVPLIRSMPNRGDALGGRASQASVPPGGVANRSAFAGYSILRPLGSGGMADVYLAKHPRLPRRDALKVLTKLMTADDEFRERFNREADLAATLFHPHIVAVHDRGEFDGQLWIAMDYVEGTDAARLVKERYRKGMSEHDVGAIVEAVAAALDYAHARGLLHRDVKPANILLTHPEEDERRILLADFGVARQLADISGITETNVAVGTVAYAAPEQLVGSNIDGRADQYALAATTFHLLTGLPPYQHSNPVAVIGQHLHAAVPRLSEQRPDLARLDGVFFKALAKDPDDRFDRCRDFAAAFNDKVARRRGAVRQRGAASVKLGRRFSLKSGIAAGTALTLVIALAITWGVSFFSWDDEPQSKAASPPRFNAASSASAVLPGASSAAARPVLDGSYRLDYDRAKQTSNGVIRNNGAQTSWWVFHSACTATGCAATGTKLDNVGHQEAKTTGTGNTGVLHFVDGHWRSAPRQVTVDCRQAHGTQTSTQAETVVWSLTPQPDGTLRGAQTQTVESNECGARGAMLRIPVLATRVGDVPSGVDVADPAKASQTSAVPAGASALPVAGGVCGDVDKLAYDAGANEQVVCEANTWDKAPGTTGVHPVGTSCDEPNVAVFAMSKSDDGYLIECDPATRVWTRQHG